MNWSRAKTILIFLFLCTAIFQFTVLSTSDKKANKISTDIITSTVEILKANNITVNEKLIPSKNYSLPLATADNAITDYNEFAKFVLGESITPNENNEFTSALGFIRFYANRFNYTPSETNFLLLKADSLSKDCEEYLNTLGLDTSDSSENQSKTGNQTEIILTNTVDGYPIFNSQIKVTVNDGKLTNSQGTWFNVVDKDSPVKLKSITSVLIDLLKENIQKPATIADIKLGYTIPESNVFQKSVILIPVWQITLEDGNKITIDARSPQ
ncbi:MAG: hypothetical protein E7417_01425 [Ruminococcaceae bacterium]|nr:hypothetical protein [Oscillospiraceae bacterium]